ncbi:hypothetical protein D9758_015381 [Tetrapyrgos nigripes]|uniref:Pyrroloquinoline quinone-dependent pyranose dehydrogenase beta-propeller domain-containing protein n=1 Tax=Tetrapyrgos nigripes TaxID=182062 RepID=A0A8H5CAE9_9AGAR|nr:hypothetical protein D9758_015381 [Tetrapyrgos nigripes]
MQMSASIAFLSTMLLISSLTVKKLLLLLFSYSLWTTLIQAQTQPPGILFRSPVTVAPGYSARVVFSNLTSPRGIAFDSTGDTLLVVERGFGVTALSPSLTSPGSWERIVVIQNGSFTHGIEVDGASLYLSTAGQVLRYEYDASTRSVAVGQDPQIVVDGLPADGELTTHPLLLEHSPNGQAGALYVGSGPLTNIDLTARDPASGRSQIRRFPLTATSASTQSWSSGGIIAYGIRNPAGFAFGPSSSSNELYIVENGASIDNVTGLTSDFVNDNPADELELVDLAGYTSSTLPFFGFPDCATLWNPQADPTGDPQFASLAKGEQFSLILPVDAGDEIRDDSWCRDESNNRRPALSFQAHSVPLDIKFQSGPSGADAFVSFHGSFDRDPPTGYGVVKVALPLFQSNDALGYEFIVQATNLVSCPVTGTGQECIRPVGLAFRTTGTSALTTGGENGEGSKGLELFVSSDESGEERLSERAIAAILQGKDIMLLLYRATFVEVPLHGNELDMVEIQETPAADMDASVLTYRDAKKTETEDYFGDEKKSLDDVEDAKEFKDDSSLELDEYTAKGPDDDPAYSVLPQIVRELCDFEDDVNMPVLTWRFYFLSAIFTALGAWLQQMGFFRTTYVPYSIYFVQIASLYFGRLMAAGLPQKKVGWGETFWFELNPGEFNIKEHVAVVLAASTGGTNNLGDYVLAPLQVFYDAPMNGWLALLFMAAVFKAMRSSLGNESATAKKQINPTAQFLGSGLGGAGFLNITLDWSNIGSQCIYYPYWAQINMFTAGVIAAWILIPIGFFTGIWQSDLYPIQTQTLYLRNGSKYPTTALMTAEYQLNVTLYDEIGPPMMSAQLRWMCPMIYRTWKAQRAGGRAHNDKLTQLIRQYPTVPLWWNLALFIIPMVILTILTARGVLYMPIYMLFIGVAIGACIVVPMGYIYAISGYQMSVGYFNELFYGYAIQAGGSRHPIGSLSYRVISGQCWYEAQKMLADMKLGHYFHIPPRAVMLAQIWGIFVVLWVCNTKGDVLTGKITDPNRQWTGQTIISLYNQSISFALVGPKLMFNDAIYSPMLYGFLVGAVVPFILYGLHRLRPRWRFDLWNIAIFSDYFTNFFGNISNIFFSLFLLGTLNHLYFKRYRYEFWKKYAYLFGAAADTGYNFAVKTITMPNWVRAFII